MKKLRIGDFKREGKEGSFEHYFTWSNDKIEICLESCLNGYCVGIYEAKTQTLIKEKICTNISGIVEAQIAPGFSLNSGEALTKAVEIANKMLEGWNEEEA